MNSLSLRNSKRIFLFCLGLSSLLQAAELPIGSTTKEFRPYNEALNKTWEGIKKRNVDPYDIPCIHRPNSEIPHDCVSEGIGYGMILALYSNDQEYFNKIWDAGETYMWTGSLYNWRIYESGTTAGSGAATDAEEDIAAMLIFADELVKKNIWSPYVSTKGPLMQVVLKQF